MIFVTSYAVPRSEQDVTEYTKAVNSRESFATPCRPADTPVAEPLSPCRVSLSGCRAALSSCRRQDLPKVGIMAKGPHDNRRAGQPDRRTAADRRTAVWQGDGM